MYKTRSSLLKHLKLDRTEEKLECPKVKKKDYKQSSFSIHRRTIILKSAWYSRGVNTILPEKAGESGL